MPDGYVVKDEDVLGDSFKSQRGRLAFFLLSPERKTQLHLRLMAAWVLGVENGEIVDQCMAADGVEGVLNVLLGTNLIEG